METASLHDEFTAAESSEDRRRLLERYELGWGLPDEDLPHYYQVDPDAVREYVDQQIEAFARWDDVPETAAFREFLEEWDPDYARELFRKTCAPQEWRARVEELSESLDGDALIEALERIHPINHRGFPGAPVFEALYEAHGDDVAPYLRAHMTEPWRPREWRSTLETFADDEAWEFWDLAVRGQASSDFDIYVRQILEEADERPGWARRRLTNIAGARYFRWDGHETARLGDEVARDVYRRYPNLLKSTLDEHVGIARLNARHHGYRKLSEELLRAGDEAYYDRLAGKFLSAALYVWGDKNHYERIFDHFVDHYDAIDDDATYAERATRVLAAFQPADPEHWYSLRGNNPLTRIFFEQPERFRAEPDLLTDLLESSFSAVRSLGFRALAQLEDRFGEFAAKNAQLVLAAPLDRLSPPGMRAALAAVRAMAGHDPSLGRVALERLREASSLAYPSFTKGELVRTMGHILSQSPELQRPSENPVIYETHRQGGDWA